MTRRTVDNTFATMFAVALGIAGALLLAHLAACESEDFKCIWTWEASK